MHEIGIDPGKVVAAVEYAEQLLAHPHQRGGAIRRKVEPADQFLRFSGKHRSDNYFYPTRAVEPVLAAFLSIIERKFIYHIR